MTKKLIIGNWKMSPETLAEAQEILDAVNDFLEGQEKREELSVVFCPPFVFIEEVAKMLSRSHLSHQAFLGAQDISAKDTGAFTGEVSGPMLVKLGVRYVIVGHSERRWKLGESDAVVNEKLKAALRNELIPVVCLGERARDAGYAEFLREQTLATLDGLSADDVGKCIIAYEPVWAISSNPGAKPDNPESALESMDIIRKVLTTNYELRTTNLFLYGGSVNPKNAAEFLAPSGIDGVLVGGASVRKEEFVKILSQSMF